MNEMILEKGDWSVNLEDGYGPEDVEELVRESVLAISRTKLGHFVNVVTPGSCGDPADWLIPQLEIQLAEQNLAFDRMVYIDQCGCGGYVTRVYR